MKVFEILLAIKKKVVDEVITGLLGVSRKIGTHPLASYSPGITSDGINVYQYGGGDATEQPRNVLHRLNVATGVWTALAPCPAALRYTCAVCIGTKLYVGTGLNSNTTTRSGAFYEYDIPSNTWTQKFTTTARNSAAMVAARGKVYLIGGFANAGALNTIEEFDPATNSWTTVGTMAVARYNHSACTDGNKIYIIAGSGMKSVVVFDLDSKTFSSLADLPANRAYFACCIKDERLYVFGGDNAANWNSILENKLVDNVWTSKATMYTPIQYLNGVLHNGKFYYSTGANPSFALLPDTIEVK